MEILLGKTLAELQEIVAALDMPKFTAKQIAQWIYEKRVRSIEDMTNTPTAISPPAPIPTPKFSRPCALVWSWQNPPVLT